jgi:hypothetical protein
MPAVWAGLSVLIVAGACRFAFLGSVPRWVHNDEAGTALTAQAAVEHCWLAFSGGPGQQLYWAYLLPSAGIFVFG